MTEQEDRLIKRFADLAARAQRNYSYTYTGFLSQAEQDVLLKQARELSAPFLLWGEKENAERRVAAFGSEADFGYSPEWPVTVLEVRPLSEKFGEELSHRDYLGAVLGLGIDRSLTGDIIIRGKTGWLYCLESIADFLCENLTAVRHTSVRCGRVSGEVPELAPKLQTESLNVASERADAVIAAVTKLSRTKTAELFKAQRVYVGGRLLADPGRALKEGDRVSVRGFGKFIYRGVVGETKKGRCYVIVERYV